MMNDAQVAELAGANGSAKMGEVGTSGLEVTWGQIHKADNIKLTWPGVYGLFIKYLRRDPQVAQWRTVSSAMASKVEWYWELPQEEPAPQDEAFLEFLHTIWDDIPGGQRKLIDTYISYILMGWMWFENVPARRNGTKQGDWVSVHDDGLIGFRDIAFRDHSSFSKWNIDDGSGRLMGFVQQDYPNPEVMIPLERSTHVTLGDPTSPEGLSPFEALWRLESFMYNLELVFGIGSEHSAGHAKFQSEGEKLTAADHANIKQAARSLLSAQEGNYVAVPAGLDINIIDVPFSAAPNILEAIKFYGHLKAQVLNMQWMSLSLTGSGGSNASMMTSSSMWLTAFNAQMNGAARVIGEQLATQLRRYNSSAFGDVKKLPVLKATPVEANIDLLELAQFVTATEQILDFTEEDKAAIRRKANFLPEIEIAEIPEGEGEGGDKTPADDEFGEGGLVTQDRVLNGAQIASALNIVDQFNEGKIPREIAIFMISTFFNLPSEIAEAMVPKTPQGGKMKQDKPKDKLQDEPMEDESADDNADDAEFARPVAIGKNQPTVTEADDLLKLDDPKDIERMIRKIERMDPFIGELLRAEAVDDE